MYKQGESALKSTRFSERRELYTNTCKLKVHRSNQLVDKEEKPSQPFPKASILYVRSSGMTSGPVPSPKRQRSIQQD
jgi:hypothetical protein